ncbi:MAG: TetR/AcrR family transcriptional regulator [Roseovarius sp.]|nr:TetR/AcrR family transcriptional regulator [Roseovarius sp.]
MIKTESSKQKFLDVALVLFSERGFHGVSLADISDSLGMTKQSVLYHFRTKEKLYGAVLADLAVRFDLIVENALLHQGDSLERFRLFLSRLYDHMQSNPRDARLIARELLDNLDRAHSDRKWYLRGFLDASIDLLAELPGWSSCPIDTRTAAVCQWIGAINYFVVAEHTFGAIWGCRRFEKTKNVFLDTLVAQYGNFQVPDM